MPTIELSSRCATARADELEQALFELGAVSVTFADAEDQAILEPGVGEMPLWQQVVVTGLFMDGSDFEAIRQDFARRFPGLPLTVKNLPDQAWERAWLAHFKPMRFGDNTWVVPTGFEPPEPQAVNLLLDPGLAFGTGTHDTTALCLEWIDRHDMQDQMVMDFGCGSGILAIAALLHGAREAWCTDIDPQAIEATLSNAEKNNVADRIRIIAPEKVHQAPPPDTLMANILAAPLIELEPVFAQLTTPGAHLILSGILREQAEEVSTAYAADFVDIRPQFTEDWALLYARRG